MTYAGPTAAHAGRSRLYLSRENSRYNQRVRPIQAGAVTINKNPLVAWFVLTMSMFVVAALAPRSAIAQEEVVKTALDEIVITGTRRKGRTAVETAVPVDVFNREALDSVSSDDMLDVIRTLVPSFQVPRYPINDGATFVRPPQLRGMSADKILVLVNGKRRHRSALVQLSGDGVHGPDLAAIPSIALRSVEVLRDGASALYGSDAIAGVFNFNLRDSAEGGEVRLQTGMYTDGDENGYLLSLNQGFRLGDNGFINISAELSDNEATSRGTFYSAAGFTPVEVAQVSGLFDHDLNPATPDQQRYGPDALTEVYDPVSGEFITLARGGDGIPDDLDTRYADNLQFAEVSDGQLVQIWGAPDREAFHSFINAGLELGGGRELYGWMNYSQSDSNGSFFHRRPTDAIQRMSMFRESRQQRCHLVRTVRCALFARIRPAPLSRPDGSHSQCWPDWFERVPRLLAGVFAELWQGQLVRLCRSGSRYH